MAKLFLVSTPIGNLKDITLRALETLKSVSLIACEDTRVTGKLLKHYDIKKPLIPYREYNELKRISQILQKMKEGQDVALVSDAGTPTISDPGFKLVKACLKSGIDVEAIPGPSAPISALIVSGFPTVKFAFYGYPPRKNKARLDFFEKIKDTSKNSNITIIFFESPHRLVKTLKDLKRVFGDMDICICRELTKLYEEIRREKISNSLKHFSRVKPRGEFSIALRA